MKTTWFMILKKNLQEKVISYYFIIDLFQLEIYEAKPVKCREYVYDIKNFSSF